MKKISTKQFYTENEELYNVISDEFATQKGLKIIPDEVELEDVYLDDEGAKYAVYKTDWFTEEGHGMNMIPESTITGFVKFMDSKDIIYETQGLSNYDFVNN